MTRRLISLAAAVAFTLTILPIPLPVAAPGRSQKDTSQPFPCQNRTCGCCSADQCWKKCCCFTNRQKVSWAKKNKVTLPQFVVDAAKAESTERHSSGDLASLAEDELETEICSLPDDRHGDVERTTSDAADFKSSDSSSDAPTEIPETPGRSAVEWIAGLFGVPRQHQAEEILAELVARASHATRDVRDSLATTVHQDSKSVSDIKLVLIIKALECRGQGSQWIVCAPVAMPVPVCVTSSADTPGLFVRDFSERLNGGSLRPPVPPPRIG